MTLATLSDADIDDELPIEPSRAAQYLLYAIAGLLFIGLFWASIAKLDRVTRGEGLFVPSNHLQQVQYLEVGIIKAILVKPGEHVRKGDVLVKVDPTQINAQMNQGEDGYHLLAARVARLEAEASGAPPAFPEAVARAAPDIVANERKLDEARAALDYATQTHSLAAQELSIVQPLVEKGIEPRLELIRARQRAASAQGDKLRAELAVKGAQSEIDRIKTSYLATVADELAKAKAEMTGVSGELPALRDKVDRTEVRSPIDGVVHRVLVATIGGVVQPGQTIVEVVPAGDTPLVEAKIKPADIGFLHVGQAARVKVSAYDSSTYGALDGKIETISPDAIENEKTGDRTFLITVRLDETALQTRDGALPLMSGMAAEVDVLNGKRTVLAYLLKPIDRKSV